MATHSRRHVLLGVGAATAALAGCSDAADGEGGTGASTAPTDGETTAAAETTAATAGTPGLDLREANVVAVDVSASGDGEFEFAVTLYHDDDGEEGYANWWQVETPDGERLGRRELLHAHGTREFTRSATVSVPEGVDCVVVRGHDRTHGYGGRAMVVALPGGATRAVDQGRDRQSIDSGCP